MEEVLEYAREKHKGQLRKFSEEPYIEHPIRIANNLKKLNAADDLIKAAYLHDTIEDTDATYDEIKVKFGKRVADLVKELTKDRSKIKALGKIEYFIQALTQMSIDALTIKLADRLDNINGLNKVDQSFREEYANQTEQILKKLKRSLTSAQKILFNLILERIKELRIQFSF